MSSFKSLKPRNGLVLIRRDKGREKTEAGIFLSIDPEQGKFVLATVVAIGPGLLDVAIRVGMEDLAVGMRVIVKANNPDSKRQTALGNIENKENPCTLPFKVNGEKVEIINQHDILAIVEEEQNDG